MTFADLPLVVAGGGVEACVGVLSYAAAPTSRASWIRAVRQNAERFCVGWTHWEYADGFGFVRRKNGVETLDPVIGSALIDAHQ